MPGVDTSTYTSIRLEGAGIHFRPVKRQHRSARAGEFPVTEANRERLREMAQEIFPEELAKTERFEVVDSDGPDTLIVKGALLDVISRVPPQQGDAATPSCRFSARLRWQLNLSILTAARLLSAPSSDGPHKLPAVRCATPTRSPRGPRLAA
jgi:hypothetical protein